MLILPFLCLFKISAGHAGSIKREHPLTASKEEKQGVHRHYQEEKTECRELKHIPNRTAKETCLPAGVCITQSPKNKDKAYSRALRCRERTLDPKLGKLIFQVPSPSTQSVLQGEVHTAGRLCRPLSPSAEGWVISTCLCLILSTQGWSQMAWAPRTVTHRAEDCPCVCAQIEDLTDHEPPLFFST